ncbi:MAG: protein-glutamine glutaminase family protein [Bacteroidota bacterium]|nr:protein-glutamine glutaminase family protein [Bacteroidota bacterium]
MTEEKASVISMEQLLLLHSEIKAYGIPFGYQQGNCHNIAHFVCLFLANKGIIAAKIWAITPGIYSLYNSSLITFKDKKKLSPTGTIDWGYHVAPLMIVKEKGKSKKMVLDPILFPWGPVHYRTWLAKIKTKGIVHLIMDSEWYLFNSTLVPNSQNQYLYNVEVDNYKPNVTFPSWFSDKLISDFFKYEEDSKNNHWLERGLAINETAICFYNNEFKPLLTTKKHLDLIKDYRILVGNINNFESVFRDNIWNDEMNQNFNKKHENVIFKYREIYETNLIKWQKDVRTLLEVKNIK